MKKVEKAIDRIQIEFEIEIHCIFFFTLAKSSFSKSIIIIISTNLHISLPVK